MAWLKWDEQVSCYVNSANLSYVELIAAEG